MKEIREALPISAVINTKYKKYRIDGLISEGGSCLMYKASEFFDNRHNTRASYAIKEFFPAISGVYRDENMGVVCDSQAESMFKLYQANFEKEFILTQDLYEDHRVLAANDKGVVMEINIEGREFNGIHNHILVFELFSDAHVLLEDYVKKEGGSLLERLETFSKILEAVQFIHNKGLIHCDLSPRNIVIFGNTVPQIVDFGNILKMDSKGKVLVPADCLTTDNFAAPELIDRSIPNRVIDRTVDIFSLGRILQFILQSGNIDESVGALKNDILRMEGGYSVSKQLESVVEKATSAKSEKRFQNIEDFMEEINKCIDFIKEPQLISRLSERKLQFDRSEEISSVKSFIAENKVKQLFVSADAGMGKTCFLTLLGRSFLREGKTVIYTTYSGSLIKTIAGLENKTCPKRRLSNETAIQEQFEENSRILQKKYNTENTVIIIDNFYRDDVPSFRELMQEEGLTYDILCESNALLVFSTRYMDIDKNIRFILSPLKENELLELFAREEILVRVKNKESFIQKIRRIIQWTEGNTYFLTLLASSLEENRYGKKNVEQIVEDLENKYLNFTARSDKDGERKKELITGLILELYKFDYFSADERRILRLLLLFPKDEYVPQSVFDELVCDMDLSNGMDGLVSRGLLNLVDDNYTIHSLLRSAIQVYSTKTFDFQEEPHSVSLYNDETISLHLKFFDSICKEHADDARFFFCIDEAEMKKYGYFQLSIIARYFYAIKDYYLAFIWERMVSKWIPVNREFLKKCLQADAILLKSFVTFLEEQDGLIEWEKELLCELGLCKENYPKENENNRAKRVSQVKILLSTGKLYGGNADNEFIKEAISFVNSGDMVLRLSVCGVKFFEKNDFGRFAILDTAVRRIRTEKLICNPEELIEVCNLLYRLFLRVKSLGGRLTDDIFKYHAYLVNFPGNISVDTRFLTDLNRIWLPYEKRAYVIIREVDSYLKEEKKVLGELATKISETEARKCLEDLRVFQEKNKEFYKRNEFWRITKCESLKMVRSVSYALDDYCSQFSNRLISQHFWLE